MRKINFRPIFYSAVAFVFALIFARQIFDFSVVHILFSIFVFACLFVFCQKQKCLKRFALILCVFIIGIAYYFVGFYSFMGKDYKEKVFVNARVCAIYEGTGYKILTLDDVEINGEAKNFNVSLSISGNFQIDLGNIILFEGKLNKVELFTEDGYKSYYYKNNTPYKSSSNLEDIVIKEGYLKLDEKIRQYFTNFLNNYLSKDISGLITTVMFGDETSLNPEIDNAYMDSGMAHLLAVSGMHIVLIVTFISYFLNKTNLKKWLKFLLMFLFVFFFTYLCDFTTSIVRALVMSLIFSMSQVVGKKYDKLNSIGLCAILILLFKPLYVFDAGFLLSFACVFCIFTLTKPLQKTFAKLKLNYKFSSSLALVTSVQIGLIPILTVYNNNFNIFSLAINLLCVPFFEFAFILTFVLVPVCMILPFLSFLLQILELMFATVTLFANYVGSLSWANLPLYKFNDILVITSYMAIFICSKFINLKAKQKTIICCFVLSFGFLCTFVNGLS